MPCDIREDESCAHQRALDKVAPLEACSQERLDHLGRQHIVPSV